AFVGLLALGGFGLRSWGIGYGLPCLRCRPDEGRLIETGLGLGRSAPDPGYYIWPHFPFWAARGFSELLGSVRGEVPGSGYYRDPAAYHLCFRFLFALLGAATVALTGALGFRFFDRFTGCAAAAFAAVAFLPVRESHFVLLDVPATLAAVGAFLVLAGVWKRGRGRDYLVAGLSIGLAVSIKYYAVFLLGPLLAAHASRGRPRRPLFLAGSLAAAGLTFFLLNPFLVLHVPSAWTGIRDGILKSQYLHGFELVPETASGRGAWHHLVFSLRYGLGLPLELLSLGGVVMAALSLRRSVPARLLLAFAVPFSLALAFQKSCFMRYTMLLVPFLCLLGAWALRRLTARLGVGAAWAGALAAVLALEPLWRDIEFDRFVSSRPDSRLLAGDWMEKNIPRTRGLFFGNPLIFGRPQGYAAYPRRLSPGPSLAAPEFNRILRATSGALVLDEHPLEYSRLDPALRRQLTEGTVPVRRFRGSGAPA
ncbi:MAG TPA: phospholipid carrier-dependent glycosyltransferase, partial [bacterium]|nr:phospholipid carrier-dependent glycosyltransferase [bacterium]